MFVAVLGAFMVSLQKAPPEIHIHTWRKLPLLCLHGGGFDCDRASLTGSSVPKTASGSPS